VSESPGILVVDDQPDTLTALEALLAPLGHRIVTAHSGEEALRRLLDQDFGVIVMDVRMPGMDGFETVELIKQRPRHEDTAVVFLTGADADSDQIQRGYSAGAVDYIVKPVDPEVLRSKVAMLLALAEKNAALRESEARFRIAFEGAPIGIGLSEVDGEWIEVNEALCEMMGLSHEQMLARPPVEIAHPDDRQREIKAVTRLVEERQGSHQAEVRFTRGDGELRYALVSVSLAVDAHDRPLHLIWQVLDMTDRRRAAIEGAARAQAETVATALSRLQRVTEAALETLELHEMLESLVERIRDVFEADLARILLRDEKDRTRLIVGAASGFESLAAADPIPLTEALAPVLDDARPVTLADFSDGLDAALAAEQPRTVMAAPLVIGGEVTGAVELSLCSTRRWTADEESLLILMTDRAGLAIANARAYERELGTVETLQLSLLPDELPQLESVEVAARYRPGGAKVGGDWYDALQLGDGSLGVAMGDVVGHGLGAAALMAQLRHATRAYALEGHPPGAVLDRLDRLVRSLEGGQMATLLYLAVEPDRSKVRLASAGHVPPLLVGPDGVAAYLQGAPDPPLGVFETPSHSEVEIALEPGSTLVLYTDGLVEQRGVSIDDGLEALRSAAANPGEDPEALCDRLMDAMLAVHDPRDDIALLVLRALPVPSGPFRAELRPDPAALGSVRRGLSRWLTARGATKDELEAIQIACHEACSNSIEHGCRFGPGSVIVEADMGQAGVVLEVHDSGTWIERPDGPLPYRGHGLPLMEALVDSMEIRRSEAGTTVRLRRQLACQATEECSSTRLNGSGTRASASPSEGPSST
jgi:PAS domain S-box-containing protein